MMRDAVSPANSSDRGPAGLQPRRVPLDAPWNWLAAGWRDLWQRPAIGLTYGTVVALGAFVFSAFLINFGALSLLAALAGGFLLLGPMFAVGLYEASRRMARGERTTLAATLTAAKNGRIQLALLGVLLSLIFVIWLQLAFVLAAVFLGGTQLPPANEFLQMLLFTNRGVGLLVIGTLVGAALATVVFSITAVSVPMLLDRDVDVQTASLASLRAVLENPRPMALWACLIVVMIAAGFFTLFAGLVIAFPLIGHATWHAYQDIYGNTKA